MQDPCRCGLDTLESSGCADCAHVHSAGRTSLSSPASARAKTLDDRRDLNPDLQGGKSTHRPVWIARSAGQKNRRFHGSKQPSEESSASLLRRFSGPLCSAWDRAGVAKPADLREGETTGPTRGSRGAGEDQTAADDAPSGPPDRPCICYGGGSSQASLALFVRPAPAPCP